ncbi:MAG: hypothetical protein BMS9Abin01_0291 [Gammaproteobacteria bacterium]|nr:MAG: hypothetical protein BMS9Abin01_0291 [Gammaproteobacteria bacterium]
MKRKIRHVTKIGLPLLGVAIIFVSVLTQYPEDVQAQLGVMLIGVLLLEAGVWGLALKFLPDERCYLGLRKELDHMIELTRALNGTAIAAGATRADDETFRDTLARMHASVDRMAELAGQETDANPAHPAETELQDGIVCKTVGTSPERSNEVEGYNHQSVVE